MAGTNIDVAQKRAHYEKLCLYSTLLRRKADYQPPVEHKDGQLMVRFQVPGKLRPNRVWNTLKTLMNGGPANMKKLQ